MSNITISRQFPRLAAILRGRRIFVNPVAWPVLASLTLGLSGVLAAGPILQSYFLALAQLDAPSIYKAVYGDAYPQLPPLGSWLDAGFDPWFLMLAAATVALGCRSSRPRQLILTVTLACFAVLTSTDAVVELRNGGGGWAALGLDAICNLLGAAGMAAWTIAVLGAADYVLSQTTNSRWLRLAVAASLPVMAGFALSSLLFLAAKLFLNPLPIAIDVVLGPGSSGALDSKVKLTKPVGADVGQPFELGFSGNHRSHLGWVSPVDGLTAKWSPPVDPGRYDVSISFFQGCPPVGAVILAGGRPQLVWHGVTAFEMAFDAGPTWFSSAAEKLDAEDARYAGDDVRDDIRQFWVQKSANAGNAPDISQFVGEGELSYGGGSSGVGAALDVDLLKLNGTRTTFATRSLKLKVNGKSIVYRLEPGAFTPNLMTSPLKCARANLVASLSGGVVHVPSGWLTVRAVAVVTPVPTEDEPFPPSGRFAVHGTGGWVSESAVSLDAVLSHQSGRLGFLNFSDPAAIRFDGKPVDLPPHETVWILGSLEGRFDQDGNLHFIGGGRYVWKEKARVNRTEWEYLAWPYRSALGLATLALAGVLMKWLKRILGRDDDFRCLIRRNA